MFKHFEKLFSFLTLIILLTAFSCSDDSVGPENEGPGIPEKLDDGIEVAPPELADMDSDLLDLLSLRIERGDYGDVHSLLVMRHNYLIFEEYYRGYDRNTLHETFSLTKSITSALMGIAINNGFISHVQSPIENYITDQNYRDILLSEPEKRNISLEHILTMTSGLEWQEEELPYTDPQNMFKTMLDNNDWAGFVLNKPLIDEPGTKFVFNGGGSILLSYILQKVTGKPVDEFAEENLFKPLKISEYEWERNENHPEHLINTGSGLKLKSRDIIKIGNLYLNLGYHEGNPVIPQGWIVDSHTPRVLVGRKDIYNGGDYHYGYHWWAFDYQRIRYEGAEPETMYVYFAEGYGGQYIIIIPACDVVFVLTGGNFENNTNYMNIIFNYIFYAVTRT